MTELRQNLDQLANKGSRYLRRFAFKESMEKAWPFLGFISLIVPVVYLVVRVYEMIDGGSIWPLGLLLTIVIALAVPLTFLGLWALIGFSFGHVDRKTSLALFDRELQLKDRLQAADEYSVKEHTTTFEQATVQDAAKFAEEALQKKLGKIEIARPAMNSINWQQLIAALVIFALALTTNALQFDPAEVDEVYETVDPQMAVTQGDEQLVVPERRDEEKGSRTLSQRDVRDPEEQRQTKVVEGEQASPTDSSITEAQQAGSVPRESMQTGLSGMASQENQPGQAASNISGKGNPEKKEDEQPEANERSNKKSPDQKDAKENEKDDTASGIAGGKGSGSGRQSASTEMLEQLSRSKQDDFDDDVDQESDDEEDEEQEAASAAKPMLNQRKAPVDRQLSPSGVGDEENPNANGRGGPGGLKKTRGVAAMLLGVPMPDKLRSQLNVGRIKVQRERAVPVPNEVVNTESESRGEIDEVVGVFPRPQFTPFQLDTIEKYFIGLREESDAPQSTNN